jgi:glyoxylase-like metal-dependent hydrolase (beta-lactamase superfamily II)
MRRAFWTLGVLLLSGFGALAVSFMPASLPLAALPAIAEPVAHPPPGMTLRAIGAGNMYSQAAFSYRGGAFNQQRVFAMGGILVQHPRGKLLFDTGFGRNVDTHALGIPSLMRKFTRYDKGTPVARQLAAAGIELNALMGIVLTHAHWDHVSGIDDMREVPVFVSRKEREFIRSGGMYSELIRSFGALNYRVYDFPHGPYLGFDHSYDVFGDGSVVLVHAGGHTPGSIIAFITLPNAVRYALVGDLAWQREGIEIPAERPFLTRMVDSDPAQVRAMLVRMHMLQQRFPKLVIVPAHDERVWSALPKLGA